MSPRAHAVDPARLAQWCMEHLGSPPAEEIFKSGYLSAVMGLRLADDREVVVKVRPDSPRIAACVEVQRRMFQAGYPCPQPLAGAASFGGDVATAEAYVPGGAMLPSADHAARAFAEAFARLIRLAPGWPRCPRSTRHRRGRPGTAPRTDCGRVPRTLTSTSTRWPVRSGSTMPGAVPVTGCEPASPKL